MAEVKPPVDKQYVCTKPDCGKSALLVISMIENIKRASFYCEGHAVAWVRDQFFALTEKAIAVADDADKQKVNA